MTALLTTTVVLFSVFVAPSWTSEVTKTIAAFQWTYKHYDDKYAESQQKASPEKVLQFDLHGHMPFKYRRQSNSICIENLQSTPKLWKRINLHH
jgi:hypothetical protein